ncbi:DUF192 domain-containing protein [Candidatus Curtissbacteria bacterium]|nr:DUF192 domain-containing protein [Candidatus Curtissbacteria bacterium]
MKKDLSILFGLFGIVAAVIIYQGASGGAFLPDSKKTATDEASVTPVNNQTDATNTNSNLQSTQVKILRLKVNADVASDANSRAVGLGGRESLAKDAGMLFVFDSEAKHSFWMKNVKFPLDIIWLDKNKKVVHFVKNAQPDTGGALDIYTPPKKAYYVLEVNGGMIDEFGLTLDNKATFEIKK